MKKEELLVIKKQAQEIHKRGQMIMNLEEELQKIKASTLRILNENKILEYMLEEIKKERIEFLRENLELQKEKKI